MPWRALVLTRAALKRPLPHAKCASASASKHTLTPPGTGTGTSAVCCLLTCLLSYSPASFPSSPQAKKRTNVIPIIEDARHPHKYRMLVGMVDVVFADVAQPDQTRIVALNSHNFLKNEGHFVISIKASCIDSTAEPTAVFQAEVEKMRGEKMKPQEQITLEPYERDHAVVVGVYRPPPKA